MGMHLCDCPSINRPFDDPAALSARFVSAFNAGDLNRLDALYEERGVVVPVPGHAVAGPGRSAANRHLLGLGLPMTAETRRVYVADDIALLLVDWSLNGTGPDGREVAMKGTATDVVRRGADGTWRYVIDNPHGIA